MSEAWIAFARNGKPSASGLPPWGAYTAQQRTTMVFNDRSVITQDPLGARRSAMQAALGLS
jgi:para-nitrobenzyl esterase